MEGGDAHAQQEGGDGRAQLEHAAVVGFLTTRVRGLSSAPVLEASQSD